MSINVTGTFKLPCTMVSETVDKPDTPKEDKPPYKEIQLLCIQVGQPDING